MARAKIARATEPPACNVHGETDDGVSALAVTIARPDNDGRDDKRHK
jgi:hypothetical protein